MRVLVLPHVAGIGVVGGVVVDVSVTADAEVGVGVLHDGVTAI